MERRTKEEEEEKGGTWGKKSRAAAAVHVRDKSSGEEEMGSKNGAVGDKNRKWNWKGEERAVGDKAGTLLFSNTCVQQGYRGYVRHIRGGIKPLSVSPRKSEVALKSNLPFRTIHSFIFFCLEPGGRSVVSSEVECGGVAKIRKKLYISYHSAIDEHRRKCTYIV